MINYGNLMPFSRKKNCIEIEILQNKPSNWRAN